MAKLTPPAAYINWSALSRAQFKLIMKLVENNFNPSSLSKGGTKVDDRFKKGSSSSRCTLKTTLSIVASICFIWQPHGNPVNILWWCVTGNSIFGSASLTNVYGYYCVVCTLNVVCGFRYRIQLDLKPDEVKVAINNLLRCEITKCF